MQPTDASKPRSSGFLSAFGGRSYLHLLLLLAAGIVVRLPALQGSFLWDDDYLVSQNPFIRSPLLILEAFRHNLFPDSFSYHYRPVQNLSLLLDYYFWNTDAYGYHLTNLILHLASGGLLYFLLRRLFRGAGLANSTAAIGSLFVALLWIIHPVHSAAVDYISGRADSLAFLFASGAWLICLRADGLSSRKARLALYSAAMPCALLALCAREIALVWLLLFLLHRLVLVRTGSWRTCTVPLLCSLILLGSYAALRSLPQQEGSAPAAHPTSAPVRVVLMLRSLGDYGRLMVYPSNLYMERTILEPENYLSTSQWRASVGTEYLSILGLAVLLGLSYGSLRLGKTRQLRLLGGAWFFAAFLPVSNLVDLNANVAEHWLYLPSVGFLVILLGLVLELPARGRHLAVMIALLAAGGLGVRAYVRSADWVNPKTFYERTMAAGGSSTRVAVNLGAIYMAEGNFSKAEVIFRRVLELTPDYPLARNNLAQALYRQGKHAEGEALFAATRTAAPKARKEYPRTWLAALNLAHARHNEHDEAAALAVLEQARRDYPRVWEIIRLESEILRQTKGPEAALELVNAFARANWWHYGAAVSTGRLLAEQGDAEAAADKLRFASRLDVHDAEALRLLATIRLRQNRLEDARVAQASAIARQPDQPSQYRLLIGILTQMGRSEEARFAAAKMASLEELARGGVAAN